MCQFSHSIMSDSVTSWTEAYRASLSITSSWVLLKLMAIELVMPSNHLILCHPLLLLPSIFPPLSMGFSRQEYWNGLPFPSPGDLPKPGIELMSPALQANSLPTEL